MEITDFGKGVVWGIAPEAFELLSRRFHEFKGADIERAAGLVAGEMNKEKDYQIIDGVAVIPISGPITKKESFFSYLFGGSGVDKITELMQAAITDPRVDSILLDIDSPGGTISGVNELSAAIFEAREQKPIVAFSSGMMASSAYWIGSAADKVVLGQTAHAGSIGVLMLHADYSEMNKMYGIKITYLTASKYKALGNDAEPLSDLAKEVFLKELDYIYGIFIDVVARNRGVSAEEVKEKMADGRIFIGQQAVDAGLADYVGTIDDAHELAKELAANLKSGGMPPGKGKTTMFGKEKIVAPSNVTELLAALPELSAELVAQGAKSVDMAGQISAAVVAAVKAEADRIMALVSAQFGEEAGKGFAAAVASGMTGEQIKAYKIMNPDKPAQSAEDKKKEELLAAIKAAGAVNPGAGDQAAGATLPVEDQAKNEYAKSKDLQDEFRAESTYVAFKKAEAEGKVRILKPKG